MGDYENGLKYQLEALKIRKEIYKNQDHQDIATAYNNLGSAYRKFGDYQNGLKYQLEALKMYKNLFKNQDSSLVASALNNVGMY